MPTQTTITVSSPSTYTLLNTGGAASGAISIYPIDCNVWLNVATTTTPPTTDVGAIRLTSGQMGAAIINQTLSALWPGFTSPAYIFAKLDSGSGGAVAVSCA